MSDLISREAVLNLVLPWCADDDGSVGKMGDLREVLDDIENLPSVEQAEWISVKDSRKPKIRERVWVTDCDGEVWIMYYNDCDCYFNEFGDVFADDIIAWQPIAEPSPYKGE